MSWRFDRKRALALGYRDEPNLSAEAQAWNALPLSEKRRIQERVRVEGIIRSHVETTQPEPAKMRLKEIQLSSKEQAYALAVALMSKADALWRSD
jgi:hypothetical protein